MQMRCSFPKISHNPVRKRKRTLLFFLFIQIFKIIQEISELSEFIQRQSDSLAHSSFTGRVLTPVAQIIDRIRIIEGYKIQFFCIYRTGTRFSSAQRCEVLFQIIMKFTVCNIFSYIAFKKNQPTSVRPTAISPTAALTAFFSFSLLIRSPAPLNTMAEPAPLTISSRRNAWSLNVMDSLTWLPLACR